MTRLDNGDKQSRFYGLLRPERSCIEATSSFCSKGVPYDAETRGPPYNGCRAPKGPLKIGRQRMTDYKAHVNEAIEALGQYLHCVAANRMIGWGEECLRDLQDQTRRALGS